MTAESKSMGHQTAAFLFPGQGSERVNATRVIYEELALYRDEVDRCLKAIGDALGLELKDVLFPRASGLAFAEKQLRETVAVQPALFTMEY